MTIHTVVAVRLPVGLKVLVRVEERVLMKVPLLIQHVNSAQNVVMHWMTVVVHRRIAGLRVLQVRVLWAHVKKRLMEEMVLQVIVVLAVRFIPAYFLHQLL
jgi:hypothetical protein